MWPVNRPKKKKPKYYSRVKEKFEHHISGNKLLPVLSLLEAVNTKTISLLIMDVKIHKMIGINRETMEKDLKSFNIGVKY